MRNTKEKSILHFAIIPASKKGWYIALCFELGIVRDGDDLFKLKDQIQKVAEEYYKVVIEDDLSDDLLNQSLPKKYGSILQTIKEEEMRKEWEDKINKQILMWQLRVSRDKAKI